MELRRRPAPSIPVDRPSVGYWILAAAALGLTMLSGLADGDPFQRFFGRGRPELVVMVTALLGAVSLMYLADRGWTPPSEVADARHLVDGVFRALIAAVGLALLAIGFDNWIPFPEDLNTPWPQSILFYPAIGFVAEIVLHVVPLAALLAVLRWTVEPGVDDRRVWVLIIAVAGLEAIFQTVAAAAGPDRRTAFFVAPHLLAIGVVELLLFRRYGFLPMAAFRLAYYLMWHIGWGHLRLSLLF